MYVRWHREVYGVLHYRYVDAVALYVAVEALKKIARSDYRGNRPTECSIAEKALGEIERLKGKDERD